MSEPEFAFFAAVALAIVGTVFYMQCEIEEMRGHLRYLEAKMKIEEDRRRGVYD